MQSLDLEEIVSPVGRSVFLGEYFGKNFLYIQGHPDKFSGLITWQELNGILEHHRLEQRLRVFKDSAPIPVESYTRNSRVSGPDLASKLRDGATLFLKDIDEIHDPLTLLTHRLGRTLRCRVAANLYAVWHANRGLDLHWDDHDALILQVYGKKQWQIHGRAPERFPLSSGRAQNGLTSNGPIWEQCLEQGDCLYIPRGWWHLATPCEDASLHITVGIYNPIGVDLFQWLTSRIKKHECMRMDVPRFANAVEQAQYLDQVRDAVRQTLSDPQTLSAFLFEKNAVAGPRISVGLPWTATDSVLPVGDGHAIVLLAPRALTMRHLPELGQIEILYSGRTWKFDRDLDPLFASLDDSGRLSMGDFYAQWSDRFTREQLAAFLVDLVKAGIIELRPPAFVSENALCAIGQE
jgi:ribosomal protein L16 Arg81 hydroxylase